MGLGPTDYSGSCISCSCVRADKRCVDCLCGQHGRCQNTPRAGEEQFRPHHATVNDGSQPCSLLHRPQRCLTPARASGRALVGVRTHHRQRSGQTRPVSPVGTQTRERCLCSLLPHQPRVTGIRLESGAREETGRFRDVKRCVATEDRTRVSGISLLRHNR